MDGAGWGRGLLAVPGLSMQDVSPSWSRRGRGSSWEPPGAQLPWDELPLAVPLAWSKQVGETQHPGAVGG